MNKERAQILRMLDEGKITAEEANQLLLAFKKAGASRAEEWKSQERWSFFDWIASLFGAGDSFSEELDWTLDGAEVSSISARTDNGSISLGGSDREQVTVRARKKVRAPTEAAAKEFARQVQIHVERNGNEVHIYKEHPRPPLGTSVCVSYEISSPRDVDADLCTSNGAIRIHEVDGEIEAVTSNGAIELQGGAGTVNLRTSNGGIQLQDAKGHVHADTSSGKIEASVGQLEEGVFSTSNGSITVGVRDGNAPLTAKTSNGSIHVALPANFSGQLDARTTNGRVRSELPVSMAEGTKNRLVGQIGEGGETAVKLRTLNGSIYLRAQQ